MCKVIRTRDMGNSVWSSWNADGDGEGRVDGIAYDPPLEATDEELQAIETPFNPQRITIGKSVTVR